MLNSCSFFVWCFWTPVLFVQLIHACVIANESGLRVGAKNHKRIISLLGSIYIFSVFFPEKINLILLIGGFAAKYNYTCKKNEQHFIQCKVLCTE